jgi:hypothetical protein
MRVYPTHESQPVSLSPPRVASLDETTNAESLPLVFPVSCQKSYAHTNQLEYAERVPKIGVTEGRCENIEKTKNDVDDLHKSKCVTK